MVAPAAARVCTSGNSSGYLSALLSSSFFCSFENISHLCSASWHILLCTHCIVPSNIFWVILFQCSLPSFLGNLAFSFPFAVCKDGGVLVCPCSSSRARRSNPMLTYLTSNLTALFFLFFVWLANTLYVHFVPPGNLLGIWDFIPRLKKCSEKC